MDTITPAKEMTREELLGRKIWERRRNIHFLQRQLKRLEDELETIQSIKKHASLREEKKPVPPIPPVSTEERGYMSTLMGKDWHNVRPVR